MQQHLYSGDEGQMLDCVLINEVVNGAFMLMKCFEVTEEKLPLHRITYDVPFP